MPGELQQESGREGGGDKDDEQRPADSVAFIAVETLQSGGNGEPVEWRIADEVNQRRKAQNDSTRKRKRTREAGREGERAKREEPMGRSGKGGTLEWHKRVGKRAHAQTGGEGDWRRRPRAQAPTRNTEAKAQANKGGARRREKAKGRWL